MEICIRKESNGQIYIDKTALSRFDKEELYKPPYNFSFVEVEKEDFEASDFDDNLTFNIEKYNLRKQSFDLKKELSSLMSWFEEYDNQVKQYQRCQRLDIEFDKDIDALDNQAKLKAERVTEIRNLLKSEVE